MKNFPIESVKVKIRRNSYIMTSSIYIVTDYELNKYITCVLSVDKIINIAQSGCHIGFVSLLVLLSLAPVSSRPVSIVTVASRACFLTLATDQRPCIFPSTAWFIRLVK